MWTYNIRFICLLTGITIILTSCHGSRNLTGECPAFCNCGDFQNLSFRRLKCKNFTGIEETEKFLESLGDKSNDIIDVRLEDSDLSFVNSSLLCKPRTDSVIYVNLNGNSITLQHSKDKLHCDAQIIFLELSRNEIVHIPVDYFNKYLELKYLDLSWNQIRHIEGRTFLKVPKLRWLLLEYNKLTLVDAWVFMLPSVLHGGELVMVNMSHNHIHSAVNTVGFNIRQLDETMKMYLDISYNNITTLTSGFDAFWDNNFSIDDFRKVINIYFNLGNNPYMCDCDFYPFIKFAKPYIFFFKLSKNNPNMKIPCYGPERLKGKTIIDLDLTEFQCSSEVCLTPGCHSIKTPHNSTLRVDCSNNSNLATFPTFKKNTSFSSYELYLSNNMINKFGNPPYLSNVTIMDLSNNRVKLWNKERLSDMKNLRILMLQNNEIKTFPEGIQSWNNSLTELRLFGNPITCNCTNIWLKTWTTQPKHPIIDLDKIICDKPSRNKGKLFKDLPMDEFKCSSNKTLVISVSLSVLFFIIIVICMLYTSSEIMYIYFYSPSLDVDLDTHMKLVIRIMIYLFLTVI